MYVPRAMSRKGDHNATVYGYLNLSLYLKNKNPRVFSVSFSAQEDIVVQKSGPFAHSSLVS